MSAPIGYLVADYEAECVDCHRPEDWPGYEDWEAPRPIFYGTAADAPHQCRRCWALVQNALTDKGKEYVRERLTSGAGHPEVLAQWFDAYGDLLGLDDWNRGRADAGGHPRTLKVVVPPMDDTYWFPDDGLPRREVTLAVHWSPYSPQLYWVTRPFARPARGRRDSAASSTPGEPTRTTGVKRHGSPGSCSPPPTPASSRSTRPASDEWRAPSTGPRPLPASAPATRRPGRDRAPRGPLEARPPLALRAVAERGP